MAYMNQEKKKVIQAKLKQIIPLDWKWSLRVRNHSTLDLTIREAPIDLIGMLKNVNDSVYKNGHAGLNHFYLGHAYDGEILRLFEKIRDAMNTDNYDNSDIQTDYFDCGHYIGIEIGTWEKPFVCTGEIVEQKEAA